MKTTTIITALVLVMLGLTACTNDGSEPIPPDPVIPFDFSAPILPVKGFEMWPTPTIDDSELQGEYYIYLYWREHKDEAQTGDELMAMCNIPEDILKNMSTPNLVRTCFNHPYHNLWSSRDNAYEGILAVMTRFNGYEELMKRRSGADAAINFFTQIGYYWGQTSVSETDMISWTLVLCTAADYMAFNNEQIVRLAKEVLNKKKYAQQSSFPDLSLSHNFYCLLGAFIAYHYDEMLPEEQRILLANFIKFRCVHFYGDNEDLGRSYTIINASLARLTESENESNQQ